MARTREPISRHGRLFGGDSMYEVLQAIAGLGSGEFNAHQIALTIGRHPSQVQKDIDRLVSIGVLDSVPGRGAAKPFKRCGGKLARTVFSLPALISTELGEYTRAVSPPTEDSGPARPR
jgi:hypothetical protein